MKKILSIVLFYIVAFHPSVNAKDEIELINLKGADYRVTKSIPAEIIGLYKYEDKGEPIVEINDNGTGLFQPHGMAAVPIRIWTHVDEKGSPKLEVGNEQRYAYTLLIQYGEGGGGNYPKDKYDLMGVTMLKDQGKAIVFGERIRRLK